MLAIVRWYALATRSGDSLVTVVALKVDDGCHGVVPETSGGLLSSPASW